MNAEPRRQFVDTNILVYAHDGSGGRKYDIAADLLRRLWADRQGCVSTQVLQELYVTITRKVPHPLASPAASDIIAQLAVWHVHRPDTQDILSAISLQARYGIAFWDAMIIQSAARLGCEVVWSEDLSEGQHYGDVLVRNPFRLLIE